MSCDCCCWWWIVGLVILYQLIQRLQRKKVAPGVYSGKVVVVTGASSGIGEQLALQYAQLGSKLVITARREDRLKQLKQRIELESKNTDVQIVVADVSKTADCERLIQEVIDVQGKLDVLVLNAGVAGGNLGFEQYADLDKHRLLMDTNYWGCVTPVFHALPHLKKTHGQVVAVSSLTALHPTAKRTAYAPGKCALNMFFQILRLDCPDIGVTVVCPGYVWTEIHDSILQTQKLKRNESKFMSAQEAARQIIDAGYNNDRMVLMTGAAKFLNVLRVLLPDRVTEFVVGHASSSAFSPDDDNRKQS